MTDTAFQRLLHDADQARLDGRFDDAIRLLRQAVADNSPLALDAQLHLGELLVLRRRVDEAAAVLTEARARADKEASPRKSAVAANLLALNERHRNPALAERLLIEQEPLLPRGAPGPQLAQWFHYRGLLRADSNDLAEAERLLFRAHDLCEEMHDRTGLSQVCDSLANLLLKYGKVRPALEFAHRSLKLKEALGDLYGQAVSHGTIGRACLLQADYDGARTAFSADLELARRLKDPVGIGIMLNSLGETALGQHNLPETTRCYLENLAHDGGVVNAIHARLGLARVRLAEGRTDDAEAEADRMAELLSQKPDLRGLPSALLGLRGAIAGQRQGFAEGERLLRQAIDELLRDRFDLDTLPWLYELRDLYQRQNRTREAVQTMARALDLLGAAGADESVSDVERWLRRTDSPALMRMALQRHFPQHLLESLLEGHLTRRARADATREQVLTVLFSDIRDYTTLSEGLKPMEVLDLINEWFAEVTRLIQQHHGFVDKFIGDAVMALFGVRERGEESAADAVRAALAMRDALSALNLRNKALKRKQIHIGIGIHTGEAVVGFVGSHLRLSYTAIGDTVNTASRLESATKEFDCDTLIGQATEEGQRRYGVAETTPRGLAKLKGKEAEVPVYEVNGWREGSRG
jgi:class 3 adenylate cyclase